MLHICLDSDSTLAWDLDIRSLLCFGLADMVVISLSWWEAWYLPPLYMDSSSTLYTLEFLDLASTISWDLGMHSLLCLGMADIVDISLSW